MDAVETDLGYVKERTHFLTRAIEWEQNNQFRGLALVGRRYK